jgi:oligopeptide/dipeptide ABC transporter ATP-binding protein
MTTTRGGRPARLDFDASPTSTTPPPRHTPALEVNGLHVTFNTPSGPVAAVRGIDLAVSAGETLAIVGESGSGKSTAVLGMLGLLSRHADVDVADVAFEGVPLATHGRRGLGGLLGRRIGVVFQDPQSSLNPTMRVGAQIGEALEVHDRLSRQDIRRRVLQALDEVAVPDPERCARSYPHQLSGGMRQRVMIAVATIVEPALLVADEPTTALDVTVQSQIVDVLRGLQERHGTAIIFISHDLSLVSGFADQTMVMYAGQVVERNVTERIVNAPQHPYTRALIAAVPNIEGGALQPIVGTPPNPRQLPDGCAFGPRCPRVADTCSTVPDYVVADGGVQAVRCWHPGDERPDAAEPVVIRPPHEREEASRV